MSKGRIGLAISAIVLTFASAAGGSALRAEASHDQAVPAQRSHPNVILIVADDLGWGDLAIYGHPDVATPNIDALAQRGVLFTNVYQGSPVSSPSRATILTGRFSAETGIHYAIGGAVIDADGTVHDLAGVIDDIAGDVLGDDALDHLRTIDLRTLPSVVPETRLGPPIGRIGKFLCVGLNHRDHARETGAPIPAQPILFMKATTAVCGPNDDFRLPPGAEKVDWEVELGVVIGKIARNLDETEAMAHIAGYCLIHDVPERAFQLEHAGHWVKGKSYDHFGPMGPFLATRDEISEPHKLAMTLAVNGVERQNGTTTGMIFQIPQLVATASRYMTLMPGDVIRTGTPADVGLSFDPPIFLRPGDVIELSIEGLGSQRQVGQPDSR